MRLLLLASLLVAAPAHALAQTGALQGAVRGADGAPVPGATVQVLGTALGTATDADGRYRLGGVPTGAQTVEARFVGLAPVRQTVTVPDGGTARLDLVLRDAVVTIGGVTVTGAREQGYRATTALQVNRSSAPLKEVPFSVQVVTQDLIRDRGVTQFGEALRYVPGLAPQVGFVGSNDRYTIRGFTVPFTYRNGFRRSGFSAADYVANVEQVEILKGAASALFGRAEPGGVVNVVTKRPLANPFVTVQGQVGSFNAYRATVDANAPLSPTIGVRLNAAYDDRDGFRDRAYARESFVAPVATWQPSERTTLTVEGEYGDLRAFPDRGFGNNPGFFEAPRERQYAGSNSRLDRSGGIAIAALTHRFSDAISGRLGGAYSAFDIQTQFYNFGFPPLSEDRTTVTLRPLIADESQTNTVVQAELYGAFRTGRAAHSTLVGVELGRDRGTSDVETAPLAAVPFGTPGDIATPEDSYAPWYTAGAGASAAAAYVQNETSLGPVRLLLGLRYDRSTAYNEFGGVTEKAEDQLSPRAGLTWTPTQEVSLYASAGRSFLPQPVAVRGGVAGASRGTTYESGAKLALLGGRLTPSVAVFHIERSNLAVADPDDATVSRLTGENRSRGVEVDVPVTLTPRWRALATYTYLDAAVVEDTGIEPGTPLINAPDHSAGLWTSVDVGGALDGLTLGLGALRIGERAANSFGTLTLDAYTRLDVSAAYAVRTPAGPVRAQLSVLNLTDVSFYEAGGAFAPLYPGAPRTVTFTLEITR